MQEIIKSKGFKLAAGVIGAFILALAIFASGVFVGFHKAKFSYKFGENYERNFMGPRRGVEDFGGPMGMVKEKFRNFEGRDFRNSHGLAGTIVSIADNNIIIKDRDNKENTVVVSDRTIIKSGRDDIKISDLKNDEQVVVMGNPGDNGVINADLIRVFDNGSASNSNNNNNSGDINNVDDSNSGN
jgi:hypothetical protein